jgi:hypothetical protein
MIFCNGAPKTGTNILQKLCGMLGFQDSELFFLAFHDRLLARKIGDDLEKIEIDPTSIDMDQYRNHFCHSHICDLLTQNLRSFKVLHSIRDPRDSLISYLRWKEKKEIIPEINEEIIIDTLARGLWEKRTSDWCETWVQFQFSYLGWVFSPFDVFIVKFEHMGDAAVIDAIANFVGIEDCDAEEIADNLIGNGKFYGIKEMYKSKSSYVDGKSRWEDYWTDGIEQVWKFAHGDRLLAMMGYDV